MVSSAWRYTFDALVACNTLVILVQFSIEKPGSAYGGSNDGCGSPIFDVLRYLFLSIFTIELALKIGGLGPSKFFLGDVATDQLARGRPYL